MAAPQQEDNYAYEEEQERKALLQGLHGPMKQWYNGSEAARWVGWGLVPCMRDVSMKAWMDGMDKCGTTDRGVGACGVEDGIGRCRW